MHEEILSQFFTTSRSEADKLQGGSPNAKLFFLLDPVCHPDLLGLLYGTGEPLSLERLYDSTEFAPLSELSPIWFEAPRGSALALQARQLCLDHQGGIAVFAKDAAAALHHARWLIAADDGSGGQSILKYHLPYLWAALAMTTNYDALLGAWQAVYSPEPVHFSQRRKSAWVEWREPQLRFSSKANRFALAADTAATNRTLQWLYWLDGEYESFGAPQVEQLPNMISNLETLVCNGVSESHHLLRLTEQIKGSALNTNADAMTVLASAEPAFSKVDHLQQTTSYSQEG